jgi:tetratricopeptide (TPR) repeat protein
MAQLVMQINQQAAQLHRAGRYQEALALSTKAVEAARRSFGEDHPVFTTSMNNRAEILRELGQYAEAEPLYQCVLEILRRNTGEHHPHFATTLNNLGLLYYATFEYEKARSAITKALEIRRAILPPDHPEIAISLNALAELYRAMGRYAEVEGLHRQALEIRRKCFGEKHPETANSLHNFAEYYRAIGDYAAAAELHEQALEVFRAALGERHLYCAISMATRAALYKWMGRYGEAISLYGQALDILRDVLGEESELFARTLHNLSELHREMGNYVAAAPLCQQALEIRGRVLPRGHPDIASSLITRSSLSHAQGDLAAAESQSRQALEILSGALGQDHPGVATALDNLAVVLRARGKYDEAEEMYHRAIETFRKAVGESHADFAIALTNLAGLYHDRGKYAEAEPHYRKALEIYQAARSELHPYVAETLTNLAVLAVATQRAAEGRTLLERALAIDDRLMGQLFATGSENQRMAYLSSLQHRLELFLSLVVDCLPESREAVESAVDVVLRRKAVAAEALAVQRDAVLGGHYPELEAKLRELNILRTRIVQATLAGPGPEGPARHRDLLAEWGVERESLETELARRIPEMNLEQRLRDVDREVVGQALPANVTLVEFVRFNVFDFSAVSARYEPRWTPARYLAFVLPAGEPGSVRMIDLGEAGPVDRLIAAFRASITGDAEGGSARDLGAAAEAAGADEAGVGDELRSVVFDPLLPALGSNKRLFLAPDGDLTRLPFEVLPLDGGRVIDDYEISYLGAGRDVLRFGAASSGRPAEPLVIADPDFDLSTGGKGTSAAPTPGPTSREIDRSGLVFCRLPGTSVEGSHISAMLGVEPWLEGSALESRLKTVRSPRILHLATHGFFLDDQRREHRASSRDLGAPGSEAGGLPTRLSGAGLENPLLRSGLALAGANTWLRGEASPEEAEDGILTAEDVSGLDLLSSELVALSACETGLGEVRTGEGVFGLRRAFILAGAKTLVMSLWKVPDEQTQELMEDFYRRVLGGKPRAESLREAQLAMKAKYPHPLYWGAFICQGDPAPLQQ